MKRLLGSVAICIIGHNIAGDSIAEQKDSERSVRHCITRALDYLATEQKQGRWESNSGQYTFSTTALAGTALLCEGSTASKGKYAKEIRAAADFLAAASNDSGLIGDAATHRYMFGHGFSMLFLTQLLAVEETNDNLQSELRRVLTNAVRFSAAAQTTRGGWGYVAASDGLDFDEGASAMVQIQALRACQAVGIPVAKEVLERARNYVKLSMRPSGGISYNPRTESTRPPITAAAIAATFETRDYISDEVRKMLKYCETTLWPLTRKRSVSYGSYGNWHYTQFYLAQVMHRRDKELWMQYFEAVSVHLLDCQAASGAWTDSHFGPHFDTAVNATILQLDMAKLPVFIK